MFCGEGGGEIGGEESRERGVWCGWGAGLERAGYEGFGGCAFGGGRLNVDVWEGFVDFVYERHFGVEVGVWSLRIGGDGLWFRGIRCEGA